MKWNIDEIILQGSVPDTNVITLNCRRLRMDVGRVLGKLFVGVPPV